MDPVNPLPAVASLVVAMATSALIAKRFAAPSAQGRYAAIDGLRGYLAFFVFLHHSCVWYFYLRTDQWKVPPSHLYTHFGQSSVALFFMITGFLFFSKLIDGRTRPIDWGRLFISRFLRLVPLYLFFLFLLFLVVAYLSNFTFHEPIRKLAKEGMLWLGFTVLGAPDINHVEHTSNIVAGVTWSLPYEWFFYFSLPLLALTVRVKPPVPYVALGILSLVGLALWHPQTYHLVSFLGGIAGAALVRSASVRNFARRGSSSCIALACGGMAVAAFPSASGLVPLLLLSVAFALIACGNTLFGVLVRPVSRTLGEIAYSLYLLHGITLFVVFTFVLGVTQARALSPFTHWLLIVGITPLLICICFVTFRLIEQPAMQSTTAVTGWLRSRLTLPFKGRAVSDVSRS